MEHPADELSVLDYVRLMKEFLDGRIDAWQYSSGYFEIATKRVVIPNAEVDKITQRAYGDADDYEPDPNLRKENPRWIREAELKALGYRL